MKTSIEWTDYSWNPIRGVKGKWHCTKVSPGCQNCYAESMNKRFSGLPYVKGADAFRLDEKVILEPLRWRKPRMVFVCSMTDLFHEYIPDEWIDRIFAVMYLAKGHTFQVLTKRAERMRDWFRFEDRDGELLQVRSEFVSVAGAEVIPNHFKKDRLTTQIFPQDWPLKNVWLGVSAEDQKRWDERVPLLLQTPAAVRWVSCEWSTARRPGVE